MPPIREARSLSCWTAWDVRVGFLYCDISQVLLDIFSKKYSFKLKKKKVKFHLKTIQQMLNLFADMFSAFAWLCCRSG